MSYAKDVFTIVALDVGYLPPFVRRRWNDGFGFSVGGVSTSYSWAHYCIAFPLCFGCSGVSHFLGCPQPWSWWMSYVRPYRVGVGVLFVVHRCVVVVVGAWLSFPWYGLFDLDGGSGGGVGVVFD